MKNEQLNIGEIASIRHFLKKCITEYLEDDDWLEVSASTITALTGACETISTVFVLPYFDRRAHLAQTAQLQLEFLVKELKRKVWTLDRSFRREERVTPRHLTEFTLVECEAPYFKLKDIMATQESILKHCINKLVANRASLPRKLFDRIGYLETVGFPLKVHEYKEAISLLKQSGMDVDIGSNLGLEEEVALLKIFDAKPFFIINYPADIKYFNMKRTEDRHWVYSIDLIAPPLGEISGGAEREDDFERVKYNLMNSQMWKDIKKLGLDQDHFEWYLSLWGKGSPGPRGGFGIGFERFVAFFTGIDDIRQCIEFPRNRDSIYP
jgi:asparaginyl-tRNA synthetase